MIKGLKIAAVVVGTAVGSIASFACGVKAGNALVESIDDDNLLSTGNLAKICTGGAAAFTGGEISMAVLLKGLDVIRNIAKED